MHLSAPGPSALALHNIYKTTPASLAFGSHSLSNSHQKPLQIRVLRLRKLLRRALEIDSSFPVNNKFRYRPAILPTYRSFAFSLRKAHHALRLRIEPEVCQCKPVL